VNRGGSDGGDTNPTNIPHFVSKHRIEKYMKEQTAAKGSKMQWAILRPVAFMDNLTPDFTGKGFTSMWGVVGDKPLRKEPICFLFWHVLGALSTRTHGAESKLTHYYL
jgi:hypothetical protein